MLDRLGKPGAASTDEALMRVFRQQIAQVRTLVTHLRREGIVDVPDIEYSDALREPAATADRITDFLGGSFDNAAAAVDAKLRHEGLRSRASCRTYGEISVAW